MISAIHIDASDTVAAVPVDVAPGAGITVGGRRLTAVETIPAGHKMALVPIAEGELVYKFGTPIGRSSRAIHPGEHVHSHNLLDITGEICREHNARYRAGTADKPPAAFQSSAPLKDVTFMGYARRDGSVGVRNHVLVVALVGCVNAVVNRIAARTGAIPITHEMGCLEPRHGLEQTRLALRGAAANPNICGVLLVGLGCEQVRAEDIGGHITAKGIPWQTISVQELGGPPQAEARGEAVVARMLQDAAKEERVRCPASSLVVGVQCGGSDWTTALVANPVIGVMTDLVIGAGGTVLMGEVNGFSGSEHVVASRAATREAGLAVLDMVDGIRASFFRRTGQSIEDVNPTPGNKAGGITTLVEKSTGNIRKMGSSPVRGVLRLGDSIPGPGLWIMDQRTNGPDHFVTSGFAVLGATLDVFSSGRGTPAGSAVMPVVKLTGNARSFTAMRSLFDFDASSVVDTTTLREAGERLFKKILAVASGERTCSEVNGNVDFVIPRESREE